MEDRLTHEILFDIFSSRLPMKSLLRLRCASRSLCNMIDDPCFVNKHLICAYPKESGQIVLIGGSNSDLNSLGILREDARRDMKTNLLMEFPWHWHKYDFFNSCNGLLCFYSGYKTSVIVLNPIKKETLILPKSSIVRKYFHTYLSYGLGHDPSTNTYKVIRVYYLNEKLTEDMKDYNVEIHTLGTSSWRTITAMPSCPPSGTPVFAYGALHWKSLSSLNYNKMEGMLVSFDMAKEVFYLTPRPRFRKFHLVDLGGSLGLVDLSSNMRIEIWLLKDCCGNEKKEREWVKEYKIDIDIRASNEVVRKLEVVGMWENGEILLRSDRRLISYHPKINGFRYIFELNSDTQAYIYRESLVSLASYKQSQSIRFEGPVRRQLTRPRMC